MHLRDGHPLQKRIHGEGKGYQYPHDDPRGWVEQQYLAEAPQRRTLLPAGATHGVRGRDRGSGARSTHEQAARSSKVAAPMEASTPPPSSSPSPPAVAVVVLLWAVVALTRTMGELRRSVEEIRREALPVVAELRSTVGQANAELDRVDTLLGTAENVTATVDSASRLAYLAFSNPVIKTLAFASRHRPRPPAGCDVGARGRADVQAPLLAGRRRRLRLRRLVLDDALRSARRSSATRQSGSRPTSPTRCAAWAPTSAPLSPRAARRCGSGRRSCGPSSGRPRRATRA